MTVTRRESNPLAALELMHAIVDVMLFYFDQQISESVLRKNFATVYQILDEVWDVCVCVV
jgi:hypothetical protein